MKKTLLSLGTIATVAAPVAALIACGATTPDPTQLDEGFNDASLINNFDMGDEEPASVSTLENIEFDGKTYSDLNAFIPVFTKEAQTFADVTSGLLKPMNVDFSIIVDGDKISVHNGLEPDHVGTIEDLSKNILEALAGQQSGYTKWASEKGLEINFKTVDIPTKNSIDSILYTQANAMTNEITTDHDMAYIESPTATYKRVSQDFDLSTFKAYDNTQPLSAELRPGDSIVFAFDKASDIASFTQRVRYVDTMTPGATFTDDLSSIKTDDLKVKNGEIISEQDDVINPGKTVSIYSLEAIAKNAIKLTINPFMEYNSNQKFGQVLILSGFEDSNKDDVIDHKDVSMSNQFVVDKDRYSKDKSFLTKESFISGYDEAKTVLDK